MQYEIEIDKLAKHIIHRADQSDSSRRLLIGIAGIPGSGKSTLAYPLVDRINELVRKTGKPDDVALCIGGDGWHFSQAELRAMENPSHLLARRGAHFTFNSSAFHEFILSLTFDDDAVSTTSTTSTTSIPFPTFSHADKDPVINGGTVEKTHRIVVIEGLYCFLDIPPWSEVGKRLDERIWVDVSRHVARERLIQRHLDEGVETTREDAIRRVEQSDLLNADLLISHAMQPTYVVNSDGPAAASTTDGTLGMYRSGDGGEAPMAMRKGQGMLMASQ